MSDNPSPEEIAAREEQERIAAEAAAAENQETPEQKAEREAAEAAAAAAAAEDEIPDDKVFSKLSKLTGDRLKSKEDLEKVLSFNEKDYIKPRSEVIRQLNDFGGDPKLFFELAEIDPENMDKKDAIIKNMMITKGYTKEDAELLFERKYSDALLSEGDDSFDPKNKRAAELLMADEFELSKENLAKFKSTKLSEFVQKEPTREEIEEANRVAEENWVKPVNSAVDSMNTIESQISFTLPDEQEVNETVSFDVSSQEVKSLVKDMLQDPSKFAEKFVTTFGAGKTPAEGIANLSKSIHILLNHEKLLATAAKVGASRALSAHIEKVVPGSVRKETTTTTTIDTKTSQSEAMVKAINEKMTGG